MERKKSIFHEYEEDEMKELRNTPAYKSFMERRCGSKEEIDNNLGNKDSDGTLGIDNFKVSTNELPTSQTNEKYDKTVLNSIQNTNDNLDKEGDSSDDDFGPEIPSGYLNPQLNNNNILNDTNQKFESDNLISLKNTQDINRLNNCTSIENGNDTSDSLVSPNDKYAIFLKRIPQDKPETVHKEIVLEEKPEKIYKYGIDKLPEEDYYASTSIYEEKLEQLKSINPHGIIDIENIRNNPWDIPYKYELLINAHRKYVSCIGVDNSGKRMVTGGYDSQLKFWDFPTMDRTFKCFKALEPVSHSSVNSIEWREHDMKLLIACSSPQAFLFDHNGNKLGEFAKGYRFATDMANTDGHTSSIRKAIWHPFDNSKIITIGEDSTCRIWDSEKLDKQLVVIKVKNSYGISNLRVTALTMDPYGDKLIVGTDDGSIQLFNGKGPYSRPIIKNCDAHLRSSDISYLTFTPSINHVISRGCDDSLKIWDVRNFGKPLKSFTNLKNSYSEANVIFDPSGKFIATGVSISNSDRTGKIAFIDLNSHELRLIPVASDSVITLNWSIKLNQILVGCADGLIKAFFDPEKMKEKIGVVLPLEKTIKGPDGYFKLGLDTGSRKTGISERAKKRKLFKDPKYGKAPEVIKYGSGSQGILGSNLKADYMKRILSKSNRNLFEDPREALLRNAGKDSVKEKILDYESLANIDKEERERAEQIEKLRKQRETK